MNPLKTSVISVRVPPEVKDALERAAATERRSQASMVEVMVLNYCRDHSIPVVVGKPAPAKRRKT